MKHLSVRVAWHDNKWNGTVCSNPSLNSYCIHLPRIYKEKSPSEDEYSNKSWSDLQSYELPPCKAEAGGFMSSKIYKRSFEHPYNKNKDVPHNKLLETEFEVSPYSIFAVPFKWMLSYNQKSINESYPGLPSDEKPPFTTSWIYGKERQISLLNLFFNEIEEKKSLILFYTKSGNPIDEEARRLVTGIGLIDKKSGILEYKSKASYTYPLWDRLITHTIRQDLDESEGVLLPYHEYLALPNEKIKTKHGYKTKDELINEIKITFQDTEVSAETIEEFSYGTEWVENNTVLNLLSQLRIIIERIKDHGIVKGNWDKQLIWVNNQIGKVKEQMGPFPSFGNALIAAKFKYGHFLEQDIRKRGWCNSKDNPWEIFEEIIDGKRNIGKTEYSVDLPSFRDSWKALPKINKDIIIMLSRFELAPKQIERWYGTYNREEIKCTATDQEILANPYIITEDDIGEVEYFDNNKKDFVKKVYSPISVDTIDVGVFEDRAIQGEYIPTSPYLVESTNDKRRIRALIMSILKSASEEGDTLISIRELNQRLASLKLQKLVEIPDNYILSNISFMEEKLSIINTEELQALQLKKYNKIEDFLKRVFIARCKKDLNPINEDWGNLIIKTVEQNNISFDKNNSRHVNALEDQSAALNKITSRKLTVLNGPAGTGKTTVMGALFRSARLQNEGVLLLAPTGKARVRLAKMANKQEGEGAYTIAQFLSKQGRFDWAHMEAKFDGKSKYKVEQNVIIDECSMLTVEDFYAIFQALDLSHVKRIILVGDPYQLPPIGAGRPFADICNYLENLKKDSDDFLAKDALARLEVVVRTTTTGESDTLTLASWFSGLKPHKNADEIFTKIGNNQDLNDLRFECWKDEKELEKILCDSLVSELGLEDIKDFNKFNDSLGGSPDSIKKNPENLENHQILTPVKNPAWGSFNINRIIQFLFRKGFRNDQINFGEQTIGPYDKVIQLVNEKKEAYPTKIKRQLSNGQIGMVHSKNGGFLNVVFSGLPNETFGCKNGNVEDDGSALELAYAITIHKSQGSDFRTVFLIVPKQGRLLSRELIYTGLTRAKDRMVVLIEGENPHRMLALSNPDKSVTAKRNTHLFTPAIRSERSSVPFSEGLIHKTLKQGLLVRSKSEVIISNMLFEREIEFVYEDPFVNEDGQKRRIPDFSFTDAAGEKIILEHLGMLSKPAYRVEWEKKLKFYQENGFKIGENLFTTEDKEDGSIDSLEIQKVIDKIRDLM